MNKRNRLYWIPVTLLLIVAVAGWIATDYFENRVREEISSGSQASVLTLSVYINAILADIEGDVMTLSGSARIVAALSSKSDQSLEQANRVLDRYNASLIPAVTYLMDADGMTVAASNRNAPDSFVGKSYSFRPYFQEAAKGQPAHYFALGITSGTRGFYASAPVKDSLGKLLGVVTVKKELDELETYFGKYPFCFLVNPDGIIFLSSSPALALKSLWPLDKARQDQLLVSKQFGNELIESGLFKKEIADGSETAIKGQDYLVARKLIDKEGWSIVLLSLANRIRDSRLVGILATVSVSFLIILFSIIVYLAARAKETLQLNEEKYRTLIETTGTGYLILDHRGNVIDANQEYVRLTGHDKLEEIIGQPVVEWTAPYDLARQAAEVKKYSEQGYVWNLEMDYVNKQGHITTVEINATASGSGVSTRIMSLCRDVTERKRAGTLMAEKAKLTELSTELASIWIKGGELQAALQTSAENVVRHLDGAFARIWLLNQEENVLELKASAGMYTHLDGVHGRIPVGQSMIGVIAEEHRPQFTNTAIGDPLVNDQEWARREGMVSFAGYPLIQEGQLLGVLAMFARHQLNEFTVDALGLIADKVAMGISRIHSRDKLNHYAETQEMLLREVSHRVKNNLTAVISLIHKESDLAKQKGLTNCLPLLDSIYNRIESLLIVHGLLSSAEWQEIKFSELCRHLVKMLAASRVGHNMTSKITEADISVNCDQAHYLALMLNELATNSFKYAVTSSSPLEISIAISRVDDKIRMVYSDNGPGYPEAVINGDYAGTSIGFDLLNGIVRQSLRGAIVYRNENGAVTDVLFPGKV